MLPLLLLIAVVRTFCWTVCEEGGEAEKLILGGGHWMDTLGVRGLVVEEEE